MVPSFGNVLHVKTNCVNLGKIIRRQMLIAYGMRLPHVPLSTPYLSIVALLEDRFPSPTKNKALHIKKSKYLVLDWKLEQ